MPRKSAASLTVVSPAGVPQRLTPPSGLTDDERSRFLDIVMACKPDHFLPSDVPLLCLYVKALAECQLATEQLRAGGRVVDGKPSAWLAVLTAATKSVLALCMRLRLSPQGRRPTVSASPLPSWPQSYYDRTQIEERRDYEES
jgi:hypothetical protein